LTAARALIVVLW